MKEFRPKNVSLLLRAAMPPPVTPAVLFTKHVSLIVTLLKRAKIAATVEAVIFVKQLFSRETLLKNALIPPTGCEPELSSNVVLVSLMYSALFNLRTPQPTKAKADTFKCVIFEQLILTGPKHIIRLVIFGNDVLSPTSMILDTFSIAMLPPR